MPVGKGLKRVFIIWLAQQDFFQLAVNVPRVKFQPWLWTRYLHVPLGHLCLSSDVMDMIYDFFKLLVRECWIRHGEF